MATHASNAHSWAAVHSSTKLPCAKIGTPPSASCQQWPVMPSAALCATAATSARHSVRTSTIDERVNASAAISGCQRGVSSAA